MPTVLGIPLPDPPRVSWDNSRVRLRRLRNEGFNWFLASMVLFALAAILLRIYYGRNHELEDAIRQTQLAIVGTAQEPSETPEQGLVAAALATINGDAHAGQPVVDGVACAEKDVKCEIITRLETEFTNAALAALAKTAEPTNATFPGLFPIVNVIRPELADAVSCLQAKMTDETSLLMPAQTRDARDLFRVDPRVYLAIAASEPLGHSMSLIREAFKTSSAFNDFVQAYFISPDSLLRIWTARPTQVCKSFDSFRLWSAKSYFTYFWAHADEASYSTRIYIDYGGNGLVQTRCKSIEQPREPEAQYQRGRLLGVLCTDFRMPREYLKRLLQNLFFSTALITYQETPPARVVNVEVTNADTSVGRAATGQASTTDSMTAAIDMQGNNLDGDELRRVVDDYVRHGDAPALSRGPSRIHYSESDAFLLPVGAAPTGLCGPDQDSGCRQAVLFYPRNPTLPWQIKGLGAMGYFALGISVVIGAIGIRLRTKSEELQERMTLLRNLQVGVVQVDQKDLILEANDRAEELFGRRLPKYRTAERGLFGVAAARIRRRFHLTKRSEEVKISFVDLIVDRMQERVDEQSGEVSYAPLRAEDVFALRSSGRASSYYARLRDNPARIPAARRRWIKISATPMMLAHPNRVKGAQLSNIFATVAEAPEPVATRLEATLSLYVGASASSLSTEEVMS